MAHPESNIAARSMVAALTTGALLTGVLASAGTAWAEPDRANVVATLVNKIAQADQRIADLRGDAAAQRQSVNQAVVDVQNSVNAKNAAADAVVVADGGVADADRRIAAAQEEFDKVVRAAYVQGNTAGALVNTLGGDDPVAALQRKSTLDIVAQNQRAALVDLQSAKDRAVLSRDSARATKAQADVAAQAAVARKQDAEDSITNTMLALQRQEQEQQRLVSGRELAERALADAKAANGNPARQRNIYDAYVVAEQQQVAVPQAPAQVPAPQVAAPQVAAPQVAAPAAPQAQAPAAAPAAPQAPAPAANSGNALAAARGFASNIVNSATSLFGFSAPAAPAAAPAPATLAPSPVQSVGAMSGAQAIDAVVNRAMSVLGVQYSWGGGTAYGATMGVRDGGVADSYGDYQKVGFDCSGLMAYAFAAVGIGLPKYSGYQYNVGIKVPVSQIKRGDMVFRGAGGSQHVALYIGNNQIIEAPQSGGAVQIAPFDSSTFLPQAVRVINS